MPVSNTITEESGSSSSARNTRSSWPASGSLPITWRTLITSRSRGPPHAATPTVGDERIPTPLERPKRSCLRIEAGQPNECWPFGLTHWPLADGAAVDRA